ncbi:MAG: hypothetical protein AAFV98_09840 [Chloroflexota bacterium]
MITTVLCIFGIPLFLATLAIAPIARWQWKKTMDAVLRTMDYTEVEKRVKDARANDTWFIAHVGIWGMVLLASLTTRALVTLSGGWVLFIMIHGLSLYLYHVRWNPNTLQRKQKLDAEDAVYEGDYRLDPTMKYGVNDEGELVPLVEVQEAQVKGEK